MFLEKFLYRIEILSVFVYGKYGLYAFLVQNSYPLVLWKKEVVFCAIVDLLLFLYVPLNIYYDKDLFLLLFLRLQLIIIGFQLKIIRILIC